MTVSGEYFAVLGARAQLGRLLRADDEHGRRAVVVLSDGYWRRQLAADPATLGQTLLLDGDPYTIVGVAEARFAGTYVGVVPDLYVPITAQPRLTGGAGLDDRAARTLQAVARLAPGV